MLRLLVLQAGEPAPTLRTRAGDYLDWFAAALGPDVALEPVAAWRDQALPDARGFDGVLMTGSPLSVTDCPRASWMDRAGAYLLDSPRPVLGVCFGEQLLARALGGKVEKNPRGREIGTIAVSLNDAGRRHQVLGALPSLEFQATHEDAVTELPLGATLLAQNDFGIQAFEIGERILAVQFHPELDAPRMRALIATRETPLRAEGIFERARDGVRESPAGPALLARWTSWVRRTASR